MSLANKWTPEEDRIIREKYPQLGGKGLEKILKGRANHSIVCRASELKINKLLKPKKYCKSCGKELKTFNKRYNKYYPSLVKSFLCKNCSAKERYNKRGAFTHNNAKFWTNEELLILTKEYPNKDNIELSKILNRPRSSIDHKAHRIGLKKSEQFWKENPIIVNKRFKPLKLNPSWKGGLSFEPYDERFNLKFCKSIRDRDNNVCMICNLTNKQELLKYKRSLSVHHIDYNKKNTCKENCVSLCDSCHSKTNNNRSSWIKFFRTLLSDRYGYDYEN